MPLSTLRILVTMLTGVIVMIGDCATLCAQEVAQWKFTVGDELRWELVQTTTLEVEAGDAGEFASEATQTLDVVWRVEQVDDMGTMTGVQEVKRIQVDIRQPEGLELVYDTQLDEPAEGLAAMLIPLFDTLVETPVTISVSSQGKVTGGELPEDMQKRVAGIPATRSMSNLVSRTGTRRIAEQIALLLPADGNDPAARKVNIENRILGTLSGDLTWSPTETTEDTKQLEPRLTLALEAAGPIEEPDFAQPKPLKLPQLEEQTIAGNANFDMTLGRLKNLSLEVNLKIAGEIFGSPVTNKIRQSVEVRGK